MDINITFLQNVNTLPSGLVSAVDYVVSYFDSLFTNNITLNINVGFQNLGSNVLGESEASEYVTESYSAVRAALQAEGAPGAAALPATSPLPTSTLSMSLAEAQALGLASGGGSDGTIWLSSIFPFSYSLTTTPSAGEYYAIGVIEHELTEVMGRVSLIPSQFSPMDLYRYSAPGVRDTTTGGSGSTAYFSLDGGNTNLGTWNNYAPNGDLGDWYPQGPAGNDAFNDDSSPGVINVMSGTDITLMEAIGYTTGSTSPPPSGPTITAVSESPNSGVVNTGAHVTITIAFNEAVTVSGGVPSLALNDGGTAGYTSGSGTETLTFTYAVVAGQNTTDLQISSLNLNNATIANDGANADLTNLTSFSPGNLEVVTTSAATINGTSSVLTPNQSVAASSLFQVTNPNSDSITQYQFENNGGGSGYFMVNGTVEPDGVAFTVSAAALGTVKYVAGTSTGTDAITVDAYDATAAVWLPASSLSVVTQTTFPFVSAADVVEASYIGYFGRAGDPAGDAYWLNQLNTGAVSENTMAASFSVQPEATAMYAFLANPSGATVAQIDSFIQSVYQDLFDRAADSAGLAYWQNQLQSNLGSPQIVGSFILDVVSGATGADQTTLANKVTVADYFTAALSAAGVAFSASAQTLAHAAIAEVTSTSATVIAAETEISSWITTQADAGMAIVGAISHSSASQLA